MVSDDQICALLASLESKYDAAYSDRKRARSRGSRGRADEILDDLREPIAICKSALNPHCHAARRNEARARCAEMLSARNPQVRTECGGPIDENEECRC